MLKDWHREDIIAALIARGWVGPDIAEPETYFVGERLLFTRGESKLEVAFLADLGTGYTGPKSLEEALATRPGFADALLWLHRRRDSKWRTELYTWSEAVSQG